jgi:hypothetical protein
MGGLIDAIFGGADVPKAPTRQIQKTGQIAQEKTAAAFDENKETKESARQVARRGTTQFRIPLEAGTTGTKTTSKGSGLKI